MAVGVTMRPTLAGVLERADAAIAANQAVAARVAEQAAADRARDAQREVELAAARRAGEHGPDWRRLQARIDARQTTLEDILAGLDHTLEARNVRGVLARNLASARDALHQAANEPDSPIARDVIARIAAVQSKNR